MCGVVDPVTGIEVGPPEERREESKLLQLAEVDHGHLDYEDAPYLNPVSPQGSYECMGMRRSAAISHPRDFGRRNDPQRSWKKQREVATRHIPIKAVDGTTVGLE